MNRCDSSISFLTAGVFLACCGVALAEPNSYETQAMLGNSASSSLIAQADTASTSPPAERAEESGSPRSSIASPIAQKSPPALSAEREATEQLYEHLQKYQLKVRKDAVGSRLVWTDKIMIEVADSPPPDALGAFLKEIPSDEGVLGNWVRDTFEKQLQTWRPAKRKLPASHTGTDEIVNDADGTHCFVNPIYLAYVLARYPNAAVLMKTPSDAVIFTVNGRICAILVPWTMLPDGTPLS